MNTDNDDHRPCGVHPHAQVSWRAKYEYMDKLWIEQKAEIAALQAEKAKLHAANGKLAVELAKKDAELAKKDAELAKKDAEIASLLSLTRHTPAVAEDPSVAK